MIIASTTDARAMLRTTREVAGISRTQLGEKLGLSSRTIAGRETGEKPSSLEEFISTAQALGLTVRLAPGGSECCGHCRRTGTLLDGWTALRARQRAGSPLALLFDVIAEALGRGA